MCKCDNLEGKVLNETRILKHLEKELGKFSQWDKEDSQNAFFYVMREYYCKNECNKRIGCDLYSDKNK